MNGALKRQSGRPLKHAVGSDLLDVGGDPMPETGSVKRPNRKEKKNVKGPSFFPRPSFPPQSGAGLARAQSGNNDTVD